ncbi:MAG: peroxiredoxin family protein [Planctomycetota bacterium]|jgi:thiol-disulfide isomerase/thioredoxin
MTEKSRKYAIELVMILFIAGVVIMSGCKQKTEAKNNTPTKASNPHNDEAPTRSMKEIIASNHSWTPILESWYGKKAPDFTVKDLKGKEHKLSEYRGKNVLVVIWATWCPPCIAEIPHLIDLQNVMGREKLAVLGVSFFDPRNSLEDIKRFVKQNSRINYPVFPTDPYSVPVPYNEIEYLPSGFFIDPEGKFKLITQGPTMLEDLKAIVLAESP